jgi:hypothetical protein
LVSRLEELGARNAVLEMEERMLLCQGLPAEYGGPLVLVEC